MTLFIEDGSPRIPVTPAERDQLESLRLRAARCFELITEAVSLSQGHDWTTIANGRLIEAIQDDSALLVEGWLADKPVKVPGCVPAAMLDEFRELERRHTEVVDAALKRQWGA